MRITSGLTIHQHQGRTAPYELNRVDLLKDVFLWAYERSAVRYAAIQQIIGDPDPFHFRHRLALREIVAEVIRGPMGKAAAAAHVAAWTSVHLAATDVARFIETAETELLGLHDGNYARYRIRPSEYAAWRAVWDTRRACTSDWAWTVDLPGNKIFGSLNNMRVTETRRRPGRERPNRRSLAREILRKLNIRGFYIADFAQKNGG
jgi:hypothetical protein